MQQFYHILRHVWQRKSENQVFSLSLYHKEFDFGSIGPLLSIRTLVKVTTEFWKQLNKVA